MLKKLILNQKKMEESATIIENRCKHLLNENKTTICDICQKNFKTFRGMRVHRHYCLVE
jgi:hypothetical protein